MQAKRIICQQSSSPIPVNARHALDGRLRLHAVQRVHNETLECQAKFETIQSHLNHIQSRIDCVDGRRASYFAATIGASSREREAQIDIVNVVAGRSVWP